MAQGQVVCLLGPSGTGKTQLFRFIANLQTPNFGGVYLNGKNACRTTGSRRGGTTLSAAETSQYLGKLLVATRRKTSCEREAVTKAMSLLEEFGMAEHTLAYHAALSGRQRHSVAIAQQLLCCLHFVLMDESFSILDAQAKSKVRDTIFEVSTVDEPNTTIIITHDKESSIKIADTIWVLGRDGGASGKAIPGAKIKTKINLLSRGLTWHKNIENSVEFLN